MSNNKSELAALKPSKIEITVGGQVLGLRKWSLGVMADVEEAFGMSVQSIFSGGEVPINQIAKILYLMLDDDAQKKFGARQIERMSIDGVLKKELKPGWRLLLETIDPEEVNPIMEALAQSFLAAQALQQPDTKKKTEK